MLRHLTPAALGRTGGGGRRTSVLRRLSVAAVAFTAAAATTVIPALPAQAAAFKVLVFSKTAAFRHDAISVGIQAIRDLGSSNDFTVDATEDSSVFTTSNLAQYKAVVFLSTTGDVLNDTQQTAFQTYVDGGGGYVGVHAAADTEYSWPYYGQLVGAWFNSHPAIQQATVRNENRAHAATAHLGTTWTRTDEWYSFRSNPRPNVRVLQNLDESTYSGGGMGDHPITWCHPQSSGRSFYTGLGHTQESYADSNFRTLLLGGIRYAAKATNADCRPENGYTTLYNGSTTGWSQAGPGSFTNSSATLTSQGGMGMLWYNAKEFGSYSLKLDWRLNGDSNSGVVVGFPATTDPNAALNTGHEVQIDATDSADKTTGAIYGFKSADLTARDAALNPPGQWNTYELLVEGERLQVFLNGVEDQRLHQHRPGPLAAAGLHRHPEPRSPRRGVVPQHPHQGTGRRDADPTPRRPRPRPRRPPPTRARCGGRRRAGAWTSPAPRRPTAPGATSGTATAGPTSSGPRLPQVSCGCTATSAWT